MANPIPRLNTWPLLAISRGLKAFKGKMLNPYCETHICCYEPDGDTQVPCSTGVGFPCYFNPKNLPGEKR